MKLIYRGAEAELYSNKQNGIGVIRKRRTAKAYRIKPMDDKIRSARVKIEAKALARAREAVNTPHVLDVNDFEIMLEKIKGKTVKELFYNGKDITKISKLIGEEVRKMHDRNIIHGDLTTSNMIYDGKNLYFVDFGLSSSSPELESKAMDLLVFKKMLKSTHYKHFDVIWASFVKGYKPSKEIVERIKKIESRARYMGDSQ